jgi:hypothetical protein
MRHISLRLLTLCVILPPALYILSLQGIETYARSSYQQQLESVLVGDAQLLLEGREQLDDRIAGNVRRFVEHLSLPRWGLVLHVHVATETGRMLYPALMATDPQALVPEDRAAVAAENFRLLQEGLRVELDLRLPHGSLLANLLLTLYLGAALLVMGIHYRRVMQQASREEAQSKDFLQRMERLSQRHRELLKSLAAEKARLAKDLDAARGELATRQASAHSNEEAMIEEIEALEGQIEENLDRQIRQEEEIQALKDKLAELERESSRVAGAKKRSRQDTGKRFAALYKETRFHPRAIEGFDDLPEDLKLRCEETINLLDRDPDQVTVKRKVFSKSRETFFEVVFAYRGRLYFRKTAGRGVEVVVIGSKNSQDRDLVFLESL